MSGRSRALAPSRKAIISSWGRQGDGPEKPTGKAHFLQLWPLGEDGVWRAKRIFSYSHRAAGTP